MGCYAQCSIHNSMPMLRLCYALLSCNCLPQLSPAFRAELGGSVGLSAAVRAELMCACEGRRERWCRSRCWWSPAMACSAKARAIISSMSINPCSLNIIVLLFLVLSRIGELENWMYKIWRLHDFPIANLLKMFIIYNGQLLFCTKIWNKS